MTPLLRVLAVSGLLGSVVPVFADPMAPASGGTPLGSQYGFTYGWTGPALYGNALYIDGPQGRSLFPFGFFPDIWGPAYINRHGQLVGNGEATADPYIYFAVYSSGGVAGGFLGAHGSGYLGSVPRGVSFGSLGWSCDHSQFQFCRAEVTGIDDRGLATGVLRAWDGVGNLVATTPVSWQLPAPVPEPGSLVLLLTLLAGICLLRRRANSRATPPPPAR